MEANTAPYRSRNVLYSFAKTVKVHLASNKPNLRNRTLDNLPASPHRNPRFHTVAARTVANESHEYILQLF